ncbi:hypothetical protein BGX28_009179, partial [Mortierella sp. GBA30]
MEPNAAHKVIRIPELAALIAQYLNPHQIAQCQNVCRRWSRHFLPFLWVNFHAGNNVPDDRTALKRNLHLIRSIDISDNVDAFLKILTQSTSRPYSVEAQRTPQCTNLKRIKTSSRGIVNYPTSPFLAALLLQNLSLTHVDIPLDILEAPQLIAPRGRVLLSHIFNSISSLQRLQHLTVRAGVLDEFTIVQLFKSCLPLPQLSELYCEFEMIADDDDETDEEDDEDDIDARPGWLISELNIVLEAAKAARASAGHDGTVTKIKALKLPEDRCGWSQPFLFPLLRSGLLDLEACEIPRITEQHRASVEDIVQKNCPNLKHLKCPPYPQFYDNAAACDFLRGCSGLQTFKGGAYTVNNPDPQSQSSWDLMITTLIQQHADTLKEFELLGCERISSTSQLMVLSQCKNLKRFWIEPDPSIEDSSTSIPFLNIAAKEWVCRGLKELCITLHRQVFSSRTIVAMYGEANLTGFNDYLSWPASNFYADMEWSDDKDEYEVEDGMRHMRHRIRAYTARTAARVYAQIGQLIELEVLELGADENDGTTSTGKFLWDLTLSRGGLVVLDGLKKLRRFHMRTDFWSMMGQAEIGFIHAEWPLLDS